MSGAWGVRAGWFVRPLLLGSGGFACLDCVIKSCYDYDVTKIERRSGVEFQPTDEQQKIIEACGTGKTLSSKPVPVRARPAR